MRCAGLHRKLGVHVSKVKSLSMDSWSAEQVETMKKVGNAKSNATYNPKNTRPDMPIDADMADSAIERFIRQKYELRTLSDGATPALALRQNTGSTGTGSWNEEPPPLPPKPGKKFGFNLRSASSSFHRSKQDRLTPPISPNFTGSDRSASGDSPHKSKPSQVFGMKITGVGNNFDTKLATLREMGFDDNRRNSEILKSSNGNVDRAVETLVRLGEGSKPAAGGPAPAPRTLTPVSMGGSGVSSGISIEKTRPVEPKVSNNPWEIREETPQRAATQPLPQVSVPPRAQSADPTSNSWNPFLRQDAPSQAPQQTLENSFQNLQVSHTGYAPQRSFQQAGGAQQMSQQYQSNPFQLQQQEIPNPWQQQQQMYQQPFVTDTLYSQPQSFQHQPTATSQFDQQSNPFLRMSRSQTFTPSNPWGPQSESQSQSPAPVMPQSSPWASQTQSPAPALQSTNPFNSAPPGVWQPQQQQQQQSFFSQPSTSSPAPIIGRQEYFSQQQAQPQQHAQQNQPQKHFGAAQNPWQTQQQQPPQQMGMTFQSQPQQGAQFGQMTPPAQPIRHDKSSILALYTMPSYAPQHPLQSLAEDPYSAPPPPDQQQQQQIPPFPQRSATMPVQHFGQGRSNPFMSAPPQPPPQTMSTQGIRHVSNESVDFVGMGASGRHSPDAFAGLSATYMR
jgi:hypothetical protein